MAVKWYTPSFSYAVTRPYPYKWFPWVVLIGGIFSLVLFSAINLAANGYELKVQYTLDPNSTVSQPQWADRRPFSWFSKIETSCQSQTLQINSQFHTNKLGLLYTLVGVSQNQTAIPSLRYTNNVLENCTTRYISISLGSKLDVLEAEAGIDCFINNDEMPTKFGFTTTYDAINFDPSKMLLYRSYESSIASLGWGQSLLQYTNLSHTLPDRVFDNNTKIIQGSFYAVREASHSIPISSPFFFYEILEMTCVANYSSVLSREYPCAQNSNLPSNYLDQWPYIFPPADDYAKILYSTILTDLGSSSPDNILTNASLLQEYLNGNGQGADLSQLETTPSTIYAEYFCQVPHRKPVGPLIVAIVIADLVFLQAIYKILTWTTTAWTERNNQQAKFCEGCLANMERGPYELSLAAPTDVAQESPRESSETWGRLTVKSILERRKSSESQQSLVLSPALSA